MIIFNFLSSTKAQKNNLNNQKIQHTVKYLKAKRYLDALRTNKDIYYGVGTTSIENDIGKAIITAKKLAKAEIASKIKSVVHSTVQLVVTSNSQEHGKTYSEEIKKNFSQKIETYTDIVLSDINESEPFIDYPDSGYITTAVYINKSIYNEMVKKDMEAKKTMIKTMINIGDKKFAENNYLSAVNDWLDAKKKLSVFFNKLPLQDNLGENNNLQDVSAYLTGKITYFFSGLYLNDISGKIHYDSRGRLSKPVMINAKYQDEIQKMHPVTKLPLKADFIAGQGNILGGITTSTYGQTKINVTYIDPADKNSNIRITVDTSRIKGLSDFPNLLIPHIDILINKTRTVALSVCFNNNGNNLSPEDLKNNIQSNLLNQGLAIEPVSISTDVVNSDDIQRINQIHADYLFYVYIKTHDCSTFGGYKNMYVGQCTGTVFVYKLPQGNLVASQQLKNSEGYGSSASGAGWDAYSKLSDSILNTCQKMSGEIK
ncbi:MAG: hypothetical protein KAG95_02895 [Bacteroidales bacterium]|nr:hypothetical protein [Bacteroidales bacterium]